MKLIYVVLSFIYGEGSEGAVAVVAAMLDGIGYSFLATLRSIDGPLPLGFLGVI
jgi:hypothetical protein